MLRAVADLKPVYLLAGTDRPKIRTALERLRRHFDPEAVEILSAQEASGEDTAAACNALGLFGGGERLVIVEHVDAWKAPDTKAIVEYLKAPTPETVLALVAAEVKGDSALAKASGRAGDVLVYDAPKRRLADWVAEQFARRGTTVDRDACRALVELVGDDPDELVGEIDKLTTWAGTDRVTPQIVQELSAGRAETSIFSLTDAWGRRDVAAVLAACEGLLERSPLPRSRELPRIVGLLTSHVGRVRSCQALATQGVRARDAATRLKLHPFAAEKAFAQAQNFTEDELRGAVVRLAELDYALKGGSRLAGDLELQRTLIAITERPGARTAA